MSSVSNDFSEVHNRVYSGLTHYYDQMTDSMKRIRLVVQATILDGKSPLAVSMTMIQSGHSEDHDYDHNVEMKSEPLELLPGHAKILDVGCANGDNLVLMKDQGYSNLTGIDIAAGMIETAQREKSIEFIVGDFRKLDSQSKFDLVFAQALIHLFPKAELDTILESLFSLSKRRVYFSTTIHAESKEGMEEKTDQKFRYRSRYTQAELLERIQQFLKSKPEWKGHFFLLTDPLNKNWINCVFELVH